MPRTRPDLTDTSDTGDTLVPPAEGEAGPTGDAAAVAPDLAPGVAELLALGEETPAGPEKPELVRARWIGHPVWNPEQGVIAYGDPIEVNEEQLDDENTLAIAWEDGWEPDPEMAALSKAALGDVDSPDEHPEEG